MSAAELNRVPLQEPHLHLGEHESVTLSVPFQAHQALVAGLNSVAQPRAAHSTGADLRATQAQLVGDPLRSVGGECEGAVEDVLLDLRGDAIGMRIALSALLLNESGGGR